MDVGSVFSVRGDIEIAQKAPKLRHLAACADAFNAALAHHFRADEGNEEATENGEAN